MNSPNPAPTGWRALRSSPLFHFLVIGAVVALAATSLGRWSGRSEEGREAADDSTIRIDRGALFAFIAGQTRMVRVEDAERAWERATEAVRRDWIDRFVREEALVREGRALGLEREDELIRRRLVQQVEFLVEDVGRTALEVGEEEIVAAFEARASEFRRPETFRFAHVLVRDYEGKTPECIDRAKIIRDKMNRDGVPFDGGFAYGDRFPYDKVYVDRSADEIQSLFGKPFVDTLREIESGSDRWAGPYRSKHGFHLVMLADRQPPREPKLEEVRAELVEALLREKRDVAIERGVAAIVAKYRVELADGLRDPES